MNLFTLIYLLFFPGFTGVLKKKVRAQRRTQMKARAQWRTQKESEGTKVFKKKRGLNGALKKKVRAQRRTQKEVRA